MDTIDFRDPRFLNGKPFDSRDPAYGPVYPALGQTVQRWRTIANERELTEEETRAYGRAVGDAFRSRNTLARPQPITFESTEFCPKCYGRELLARLEAGVRADRARRTNAQIIAAYHEAMKEKRKREAVQALKEKLRNARHI